jgi:hypothetical protein
MWENRQSIANKLEASLLKINYLFFQIFFGTLLIACEAKVRFIKISSTWVIIDAIDQSIICARFDNFVFKLT